MKDPSPTKEYSDEDLRNLDIVTKIFESGTQKQLQRIQDLNSLSNEIIELSCYYAKQRRQVLDQMEINLTERESTNPHPTEEELSMGTYLEKIEPQVIEAVRSLRRKGYATFYSGYDNFINQSIGFRKNHLTHYDFPNELRSKLKEKHIEVIVKPAEILLKCSSKLTLEEMKEIWDQIEATLPDLEQKPYEHPDARKWFKVRVQKTIERNRKSNEEE